MITDFKLFETQNTENDDHHVGDQWYLNNDKKFGEKTPTQLPLDFFEPIPDEGDVDEEDYYSTPAGKSGLYNGVEPKKGSGLTKAPKAIYSMSAESVNVQDIMSFPTYITKMENKKNMLEKYYYEVEKIPGITELSDILEEKIDNKIGFSFVMLHEKIFILTDNEDVHMLINNQLLPLKINDNLFNLIQGEL